MATQPGGRKTNRLAQEQSAYLLQHAENPVDWLPWGEEAFALARQRDCPIFLSIGYSSCHWCHVMEHESFESEEIAEILNNNFVSIKVDKEERPDVDKTYMTYIQATQGGGGWPMSVFLTPDLHPFFGGTYFPPADAYGRPGFKTVLTKLASVWSQKNVDIKSSSADTMRQLSEIISSSSSSASGSSAGGTVEDLVKAISVGAKQFEQRFDAKLGGFTSSSLIKFPRPSELLLLMTEYARLLNTEEDKARKYLHMAAFTMNQMARGGMRDQLGGGFHRYSVDEYWHVPHFEIMLYDNPQLVQSNLAAYQINRDLTHASVARGVLDYLLRDLKHPEGGFCAAEDADSLDTSDGKKKEGQFYVWTRKEIDEVLGGGGRGGSSGEIAAAAAMFTSHYGIKSEGNCTQSPRSDPHHEFQGKNVLYEAKSLEETATAENISIGEAEEILSSCREKLFKHRTTRPRPFRDDKILAAWNGMAIGAFATAGRVLASEDPPLKRIFPVEGRNPSEYIQAAKVAVECIRKNLYDSTTGQLYRAYMNAPSTVSGFSDDYAWVISGLLELYFAIGEVEYVQWAIELQIKMDELFWDENHGGYFQSPKNGDSGVLLKMKEDYDGAEPAASSIAASNLWKLAALSGTVASAALRKQAEKCACGFAGQLIESPSALPQMLTAVHLLEVGFARQVVIAGCKGAPDTEALINAAYAVYAADRVVIHLDLGDDLQIKWWQKHNPEVVALAEATGMTADDPATAFICQNFTCKKPTTDPEVVKKALEEPRGAFGGGRVQRSLQRDKMGASMPAAMKARPIAARLTQRRQNAILAVAAIIFIGMLMLRGELLLNLKAIFPTAPDANNVPLQSPIERTPIVLAQPAAAATPPSLTLTKKKKQPPSELPRIALLFLTRGPMPLENIWRDFLNVDEDYIPSKKGNATWQKYYTMYVHTSPGFKYPSNSLFTPFTVDHPIPAKWGDHSIIDAERKLLVTALKEPSNSFFVLLSETHIPLYSSAATYLQLATAEHSRVHACGNDSEEDEYRRMTYRMAYEMKLVNSGIEEKTWRKSSQWFGLIRSHAKLVAEETIVDAAFKQYCYILPDKKDPGEYIRFCVSDEHYVPTMLAINKLEEECDCDGHVTRVVWTGNFMHPKSFGREEATMDTLRHELRGEHECRQGRVLERVADQVLRKVDLVMEGADDVFVDGEDEEESSKLTGLELINYAIESEKAVVMLPSCPLFARKIVQEAEPEWRDLLKTVLQPI